MLVRPTVPSRSTELDTVERKPGDLEKKGRNTKEGESERRRPKKEGKSKVSHEGDFERERNRITDLEQDHVGSSTERSTSLLESAADGLDLERSKQKNAESARMEVDGSREGGKKYERRSVVRSADG